MTDARARTAGDMGEFALVDAITSRFAQGPQVRWAREMTPRS